MRAITFQWQPAGTAMAKCGQSNQVCKLLVVPVAAAVIAPTSELAQEKGLNLHEASTTGDHNVLDTGKRLELGATGEDRGILPDAKLLKEVCASASCMRSGEVSSYRGNLEG